MNENNVTGLFSVRQLCKKKMDFYRLQAISNNSYKVDQNM